MKMLWSLWLALPGLVWAQHPHHDTHPPSALRSSSPPPAQTDNASHWRASNDTVGNYPRGHADVLRWEQSRPSARTNADPPRKIPSWSLEQAVNAALQHRPDLLVTAPGLNALERQNVQLQVQELRFSVERAWTATVAARQNLAYQEQVLSAVETGTELARRMAAVGNWSAMRLMEEELALWNARAQQRQAEQTALTALETLWRTIGPTEQDRPLAPQDLADRLPDRLPDLPALHTSSIETWEQQALRSHPRWPQLVIEAQRLERTLPAADLSQARQALHDSIEHRIGGQPPELDRRRWRWTHEQESALDARAAVDALERQIRSDVRQAAAGYRAALTQYTQTRDEVQRLYTALQQETQLRYNGMLKNTWDLLASGRARVESVNATLQAQRDAWMAWIDLQAVLAGLPYTPGTGASSPASASASPQGH